MKKTDTYLYPAIFGYEPSEEISIVFPDLDVATSGTDDADAIASARELLGITFYGMEEDGAEIPAPTPLDKVQTGPNKHTVLIDVFMPSIRMAAVNKAVNLRIKQRALFLCRRSMIIMKRSFSQ